jgi:hypothetical protein
VKEVMDMRAGTAAAVFLLSTASAAGATTVPASAATAPQTVVVNCYQEPQVRPSEIILACADANDLLAKVSWTRWDARTAVGSGEQRLNDCLPNCVGGTFRSYPVAITLSGAQPWPHPRGTYRFTTLTFRYTGARPPGRPAQVTGDIP